MTPRRAHGSLESAVLQVLWSTDAAMTGRQVQQRLAGDGDPLALTTVLTVLTRLAKKGVLERNSTERTFRAVPASTDETAETMAAELRRASDRGAVLQRFTGALEPADLRALRAALRKPRRTGVVGRDSSPQP